MKNLILKNQFCYAIVAALSIVAMTGCSDDNELWDEPEISGPVTIVAQSVDMIEPFSMPEVLSRANDPKNEAEKKINTLHLFFFDNNGQFITSNADNFKPYIPNVKNFMFVIKDEAYKTMTDVTIVAIANINGTDNESANYFTTEYPDGTVITAGGEIESGTRINPGETRNPNPYKITCLADLQKWVYAPKLRTAEGTDITQLPKAGMPMIGMLKGVDLSKASGNTVIPMKALMARVDIRVTLDPNQESTDGRLPQLTIKEYGVMNMPTTVPYTMPDTVAQKSTPVLGEGELEKEIKVTLENPIVINKNTHDQDVFTYYTYENIQYPDKGAIRADGTHAYNDDGVLTFPAGVTTAKEKQRWKPTIAYKDRASAMVLRGSYVTHQGLTYEAEFKVFMGQNTIDDFKVKRNHKYVNNITIHGLDYVRNSDDNTYTFDGRVNVKTDNPVYLAIVNERKVDAHASVRPMDVWFLLREPSKSGEPLKKVDWYSEVEVSIVDPDKCGWVRMELVPRSVMEKAGFKAGTGARDYFTTDLVTNTLAGNDRVIIRADKDNNDPNYEQSRSRVYFYIDENVTPNAQGEILDRIAKVKIVYRKRESENGPILDERERILEIEQRGLKKITYSHPSGGTIDDTYMEYYEEYLEHYDPLDQHTMPGELYEGMPWGVEGTRYDRVQTGTSPILGRPTYDNYSGEIVNYIRRSLDYVYDKGLEATQWVLFRRRGINDYVSMSTVKLYNDAPPVTAFHYCYGKNKRNADGSVPSPKNDNYQNIENGGWYLPGIRELERALTEYYLTFPDFRGNFYWSASAAQNLDDDGDGDRDGANRARATKAIVEGSSVRYAESGGSNSANNYPGTNNDKGRAERSRNLRVRAFYKLPK
ncbi:fimbrial protein [uncultured Muribaculum sp.]|uniref:fimbrial protein n=4 Tax=uncultured Muribaculum sp. TaxID=1918613 RepID=UPI00259CAD66|nr:fimbrial protein [uncultured Muribaculum sp.]